MDDAAPLELRNELLSNLETERTQADGRARRLEARVMVVWWGNWVFLGAAGLAGFLGVPFGIPSWIAGLLALLGAGCEIARQKAPWREKSNAQYALRDQVAELANRLKFEMPQQPTAEQIARISLEYRAARKAYGETMAAINTKYDKLNLRG